LRRSGKKKTFDLLSALVTAVDFSASLLKSKRVLKFAAIIVSEGFFSPASPSVAMSLISVKTLEGILLLQE